MQVTRVTGCSRLHPSWITQNDFDDFRIKFVGLSYMNAMLKPRLSTDHGKQEQDDYAQTGREWNNDDVVEEERI